MQTILDILTLSSDYLAKRGIENPRRQAEDLVSDVLGLKRMDLYLLHDKPVDEKELNVCREWLKRRGQGEPLQYIVGTVDFLGCHLEVNRDVLIPRPETEILADIIANGLAKEDVAGKTLWDVCCGSGCIGISLQKKFPQLGVVLSDISPKALAIAQKNAEANDVAVTLQCGDLLAPFAGQKADYFVCNPPYIAAHEYSGLQREVRDHEPKGALIAGETGLEIYRRLADELPLYLKPRAKAWFEIGAGQGVALLELFKAPHWRFSQVAKDWSGKERFFFLEFE